jgi:hypothetical protein
MEDKTFREEEVERERRRVARKARLARMRERREELEDLVEETNKRLGLPSIDELASLPRKRR